MKPTPTHRIKLAAVYREVWMTGLTYWVGAEQWVYVSDGHGTWPVPVARLEAM